MTLVPANASETVFGINIREDELVEYPETFAVGLRLFQSGFNPFGGGADRSLSELLDNATVTIVDNDCKISSLTPMIS